MFRTIYWYSAFALTLIAHTPKWIKIKHLEKQGKIVEKEAYVHQVTKKWVQGNLKRSGATIHVEGLENIPNDRNVVFIANHQSNFDIALLMGVIDKPKGFIAKIEMEKVPFIRTWMRLIHCVFMDRSTMKGAASAIIEGIKLLQQGYSLVIFPEGTRSKQDAIGEFKAASFKLATKPKIPIIPITINGSYKIMEQNHNKIVPNDVWVTVHPLIETATLNKEELNALPDRVITCIESKLPNTKRI